eukprot:3400-Heterococcus_DN1.PRE.8
MYERSYEKNGLRNILKNSLRNLLKNAYQHQLFRQTSVDQLVSGLLHGRTASYKEQFGTVRNRKERCACACRIRHLS